MVLTAAMEETMIPQAFSGGRVAVSSERSVQFDSFGFHLLYSNFRRSYMIFICFTAISTNNIDSFGNFVVNMYYILY